MQFLIFVMPNSTTKKKLKRSPNISQCNVQHILYFCLILIKSLVNIFKMINSPIKQNHYVNYEALRC